MFKRIQIKLARSLGAAALVATFAGCGGGSSSATVDPSASADSFVAYVRILAATSSESSEATDISTITAQGSDTTEPQPL